MRPFPRRALVAVLAVLAVFAAGAVAAAGELPRLPKDLKLPQGDDSPGQVVFRHESHVDAKKPSCTGCHPELFPMLHESALPKGTITHERMQKKGEFCGRCHGKDKAAFDFDDACENCHSE